MRLSLRGRVVREKKTVASGEQEDETRQREISRYARNDGGWSGCGELGVDGVEKLQICQQPNLMCGAESLDAFIEEVRVASAQDVRASGQGCPENRGIRWIAQQVFRNGVGSYQARNKSEILQVLGDVGRRQAGAREEPWIGKNAFEFRKDVRRENQNVRAGRNVEDSPPCRALGPLMSSGQHVGIENNSHSRSRSR